MTVSSQPKGREEGVEVVTMAKESMIVAGRPDQTSTTRMITMRIETGNSQLEAEVAEKAKYSKEKTIMILEDTMRVEEQDRGTQERIMTMITIIAVTMPTRTGLKSPITIGTTTSTIGKNMINMKGTVVDMMIMIRVAGPILTGPGSQANMKKLSFMIRETKTNADPKSKLM